MTLKMLVLSLLMPLATLSMGCQTVCDEASDVCEGFAVLECSGASECMSQCIVDAGSCTNERNVDCITKCVSSGGGTGTISISDPSGDQTCTETATGDAPPALDILGVEIVGAGNMLNVTSTFNGDAENYPVTESSPFPFSLQIRTKANVYIEVFFSTGQILKVADGKVEILDFGFSGTKLNYLLRGIGVDEIEAVRASSFIFGDSGCGGSFDDEAIHGTWQ